MIYLIDDKTNRQNDFGWDKNKLQQFDDVLKLVSRYSELEDIEQRKLLFAEGNIILFHESFFDNVDNNHRKDSNEIRNALNTFVTQKQISKVIFFSGSYNSRVMNDTGGSIPVAILYQNLNYFLKNCIESGIIDLNYLFYGKSPEIENELINMRDSCNSLLIKELSAGKISCKNSNIVITGNRQGFPLPFINTTNHTIFNKNITDNDLTEKIYEWFTEKQFDSIFIPLCFGPSLSDYNGLRLATHIRCTESSGQLKPIYIYSFVDYSYLYDNEYFDILKTKNVFLININLKSFATAVEKNVEPLTSKELANELKKINIKIPLNYEDNHSIANEWAIYKWSSIIDTSDDDIAVIKSKLENDLYFKYLKVIYPLGLPDLIKSEALKINFKGNPKVLYIDDEAEKGWSEIFCKIFDDENKIYFRHLDDDFNEKNKNEIIDISLNTIIDNDFDLVILDFRLHKDDFENSDFENITGYQLLKKIKEYNKGIQVIIFSATNKIWNLQALQNAGADGFIIKESPENSEDSEFTKKSVEKFISKAEECLSRSFLKSFFNSCSKIKKNILATYSEPQSPFDDFKKELIVSLKIMSESANNVDMNISSSLDVVFLNCYNFLEKYKLFYVAELRYKLLLGFEQVEMNRYYFIKGRLKKEKFIRKNANDNPSFFHSVAAILIDYFEIIDAESKTIKNLFQIKEARNNYIHGDKVSFTSGELVEIINICKLATDNLKD